MIPRSVLIGLVASFVSLAQQPNTDAASLIVNGVNGPPFPIVTTIEATIPGTALIQGHPNLPWAILESATDQLQTGAASVLGGMLDLPLSPLPLVVLDGFHPGSPLHTNGAGTASASATYPLPAVGSTFAYQGLLADPLSAYGFTLSAAVGVTIVHAATTISLSLGDESVYNLDTGALQIPFYGNNYTHLFICSNGYITFGMSDGGDFTPSNTEFNIGPPRIAGLWCDLDGVPGSVVVTVDASTPGAPGFVRADYNNVFDYAITPLNLHTFSMQIYSDGLIQIIHSQNTHASLYDQLVGIGPGGSINPLPQKNLSALHAPGSYQGAVNESFFEWFGLITQNPYYTNPFDDPYDLFGQVLTFIPMGTGALPGSTNRYLMY